ncbi:MAG: nucleotidyltransferase domain-containing protein [Longimicrobiaceae bacterium]
MKLRASARHSSLSALFPSLAMARLVIFFLVHPNGRFHVRELQRRTLLSSASLQKELARLCGLGALRRQREGARAVYAADEENGCWHAWMLLMRAGADPVDVLREALVDAPGLDLAFVFGSVGRGEPRPESDLDLFLAGPREALRQAMGLLVDADLFLPRRLDVIGRDRDQLSAEAESGFVQRVMAQPKRWVVGGPDLAARRSAA